MLSECRAQEMFDGASAVCLSALAGDCASRVSPIALNLSRSFQGRIGEQKGDFWQSSSLINVANIFKNSCRSVWCEVQSVRKSENLRDFNVNYP